jgi:LysM repeat protein
MSYNEYDATEPDDDDYDDERELPVRRTRTSARLAGGQIAFIIGLNAVISLIISLAVVILASSNLAPQPGAALSLAGVEASPAVEGVAETPLPLRSTPGASGGGSIPTAQPVSPGAPPEPTRVEPTVYVVQPGDTLSSVARQFDVSLPDLMAANGLTDPDYVQEGQQLIIPIGGLANATPTFTPVPIPTDTPLPFNPPTPLPSGSAPPAEPAATLGPTPTPVPTLASAAGNEISLALQVLNPGNLSNEAVQIVNQGPFVRLTSWKLSDEEGNVYTFPDFSLWGGGAINVHTAAGTNTTTDLYWGQPSPMWKAGELVTLSDAGGSVIATYRLPPG